MPYRNWFIGIDAPAEAETATIGYLKRLHEREPQSLWRSFELAQGRRFSVVAGSGPATVENARFWCQLIGPRAPETALLRALEACGSFEEIHRACVAAEGFDNSILAVDREAGTVLALTDRLNFSPIFHRAIGNQHIFASMVSLLPRDDLSPDPAAIASYVLNGTCLLGRTLYREVAALPRAASHRVESGNLRSSTYWRYAPGEGTERGAWQPEAAGVELWQLLARSVDRTTRGKQVLLALSGGYDSGVLLGLLGAELKHPDVVCFSYACGEPKPDSDAAVAARQAALYGYRHVTVASYAGDFAGMIDRNAEIGEGLRAPAYEIEAYPALAARFAPNTQQVMLFGDECFGWGSYRLRDRDDLLGAINLKSPAHLDRFGKSGSGALEVLQNALESDYEKLRETAASFGQPDDAKDFLYLDQRLQGFILPLRRRIAGHWFPVALPFLVPEVVAFMAQVPAGWRIDKRLFRTMGRRSLPELFRIPRATRGQLHPDFDTEILRAAPLLARSIAEQNWGVDGILPSDGLGTLLREFETRTNARSNRSPQSRAKQRIKKGVKSLLAGSRFLEDRQRYLRRLSYNEFNNSPGTEFMLMNLLCAADFLAVHRRNSAAVDAEPKSMVASAKPLQSRSLLECR